MAVIRKEEPKRNQKPVELTLFDLILRDMEIDAELIKTFRGNLTSLKGYMASIGNMRTRETFRKFITDSDGVLSQMANQRAIVISAIKKAKNQCDEEQQQPETEKTETPSSPPTTSVENAAETKSIPSDLKTSSAPDALEQGKSPAQPE